MASGQLEYMEQGSSYDDQNPNINAIIKCEPVFEEDSQMDDNKDALDALDTPEHNISTNVAEMPLDDDQNKSIIKTEESDGALEDNNDDTVQEAFFMPEHFLSQTLTHSESDEEFNCVMGGSAETLYTKSHAYDTGRKRVRYSCNVCEKDFKDKRECVRHVRIHTGEKPFTCYLCGDSFAREDYLARHIESHNPDRPFPCDKCNKAFAKKATLVQHLLTHTDMSERPYPCTLCESAFVKKSHLERHMKTHTAKKDFVCTECGKAFLEKRRMLDHFRRLHANRVLPSCEICHKEFRWDHLLRRHMKAYHNSSIQASEDQLLEIEENLPIFVSKAEREANPQNPSIETSESHSLYDNVRIQASEDKLLEIEENLPIFVSKAERELQANPQNPSIETSESHSLYDNVPKQATEDQLLEIEENLPIFVSKAEREHQANQQNSSIETSESHSLYDNVPSVNGDLGGIDNDALS